MQFRFNRKFMYKSRLKVPIMLNNKIHRLFKKKVWKQILDNKISKRTWMNWVRDKQEVILAFLVSNKNNNNLWDLKNW